MVQFYKLQYAEIKYVSTSVDCSNIQKTTTVTYITQSDFSQIIMYKIYNMCKPIHSSTCQ